MRARGFQTFVLTGVAAMAALALGSRPAMAWGDDGHKIVALIAQSYLTPSAAKQIRATLAADTDDRVKHDIASEATWADYAKTPANAQWHFVDIEISAPDPSKACFGIQPVPTGKPASDGPAQDCVFNKIDEFAAELADPQTDPEERLVALKFLLHLVGDIHQPLHAADDNDRGGNNKRVNASGFKVGNLHHFWDTEFVDQLGEDPASIAADLAGHISPEQAKQWASGKPEDWALESFQIGRDDAYGQLPEKSRRGSYHLDEEYVTMATNDVSMQLSKAGVRLAMVLNQALR